uniref:Uncharacterized protein n=1 Tax=Schistosoma japonicum TaxID=6182 RepID=Q5C3Q9_SCHJA|nr:unknown [Schistosoma japonicum]
MTELIPQTKNLQSLLGSISLCLARISFTACGLRFPLITLTLTPAFSKTSPFSRTHEIPPPPARRSHLSTLNLAFRSIFSISLHK